MDVMDAIERAEADAEPEPEPDLDLDLVDAHLSSFFKHLVQPVRVPRAEPKTDPKPEPEADLVLDSIDELLRTSVKSFLQSPPSPSLPLPTRPLDKSFLFKYDEHTPKTERWMVQEDIYGRFRYEDTAPDVQNAEVIDSVTVHEPSPLARRIS